MTFLTDCIWPMQLALAVDSVSNGYSAFRLEQKLTASKSKKILIATISAQHTNLFKQMYAEPTEYSPLEDRAQARRVTVEDAQFR